MVRRKCLDCPALISHGSRCRACQERYRGSYDRNAWPRLVKARDGCCVICGSRRDLKAHHVVPLSRGGGHGLSNGVTLCGDCHQREHGKP